jgi:hypothetical protein
VGKGRGEDAPDTDEGAHTHYEFGVDPGLEEGTYRVEQHQNYGQRGEDY